MGPPVFRPVAEHALHVDFSEVIDPEAQAAVLALDRSLADRPIPGQRETVPAYTSLLVTFDPLVTDHAAVASALRARIGAGPPERRAGALHTIGVCYDPDLAPDLAEAATRLGLDTEAVIAAHLSGTYDVAMYGFAPGYAYLAGVPASIRLPRRSVARRGVSAGSVIIAGPQCLVTTLTMPTGWWVIGRSPDRILDAASDRPFRFEIGDRVRFRRIARAQFEEGQP